MILNIHGYNCNRKNKTYQMLTNICQKEKTIFSPQIDYDDESPREIFDMLSGMIEDDECGIELIVANGVGGFFGYALAAKYNLPVILVSPSLLPFISMYRMSQNYNPKYKHELLSIFGECMYRLALPLCTIIVGKEDKIIDHDRETRGLLPCARYYEIEDMDHEIADDNTTRVEDLLKEAIDRLEETYLNIMENL